MKKFIALLLVFFLFVISGSLLAQEEKKFEASLMGGVAIGDGSISPVGFISIGWYFYPEVVEFEVNSVGDLSDIVFSGNFSFHLPFTSGANMFFTGGGGICIHGTPFWNLGGGVKIRLRAKLSFRADLRYYFYEEEGDVDGALVTVAGISYRF